MPHNGEFETPYRCRFPEVMHGFLQRSLRYGRLACETEAALRADVLFTAFSSGFNHGRKCSMPCLVRTGNIHEVIISGHSASTMSMVSFIKTGSLVGLPSACGNGHATCSPLHGRTLWQLRQLLWCAGMVGIFPVTGKCSRRSDINDQFLVKGHARGSYPIGMSMIR